MYLSAEDRNRLEIQKLYDKCVRAGIKLDPNVKFCKKLFSQNLSFSIFTSYVNSK